MADATVQLNASEALSNVMSEAANAPPIFGIFNTDGTQALFPDNITEFSYRREYDIASFPVIAGSFANYNKVIKPFEIHLRVTKSGTKTELRQFLDTIESMTGALTLYNICTRESTYTNVNLHRYEVTRKTEGAYWLNEVDLYFSEIIQVTAQYTTTKVQLPNSSVPSGKPATNVGTGRPVSPTAAQTAQGAAALVSSPLQH